MLKIVIVRWLMATAFFDNWGRAPFYALETLKDEWWVSWDILKCHPTGPRVNGVLIHMLYNLFWIPKLMMELPFQN